MSIISSITGKHYYLTQNIHFRKVDFVDYQFVLKFLPDI